MFEPEKFVEDCRLAMKGTASMRAVRELVEEAVADPAALHKVLGEPNRGTVNTLHRSDDLTVLHLVWAPRMTVMPHNHNMSAVIGVYNGREDNIFWRRIKDDPAGHIEAAGADSLGPGKALQLGSDIIHSVTNPTSQFTSAIHVYAGNFFEEHRSEWDPQDLTEQDYDVEKTLRLFEKANAQL